MPDLQHHLLLENILTSYLRHKHLQREYRKYAIWLSFLFFLPGWILFHISLIHRKKMFKLRNEFIQHLSAGQGEAAQDGDVISSLRYRFYML